MKKTVLLISTIGLLILCTNTGCASNNHNNNTEIENTTNQEESSSEDDKKSLGIPLVINDYSVVELSGIQYEIPSEWMDSKEEGNEGQIIYYPNIKSKKDKVVVSMQHQSGYYTDAEFNDKVGAIANNRKATGGIDVTINSNPYSSYMSNVVSCTANIEGTDYTVDTYVYRGGPEDVFIISTYKTTNSLVDYTDVFNHILGSVVPGDDCYKIGEKWSVDDEFSLVITDVNQYTGTISAQNSREPKSVYIVDYEYENIGVEEDHGLIIKLGMDQIVDSDGEMGFEYNSANLGYYPQWTPIGGRCHAQAAIGVEHIGTFEITVHVFYGSFADYSAKFRIDVD